MDARCRCGKPLGVPANLALPSERCPDCMMADEEAQHNELEFDYWNAPRPHTLTIDDAQLEKSYNSTLGAASRRMHWTVTVTEQAQCPYCGHEHSLESRHVLEKVVQSDPTPAESFQMAAGIVRAMIATLEWRETHGVLCPQCLHFTPRAFARHFPRGLQPFLDDACRTAQKNHRKEKYEGVISNALLGLAGAVALGWVAHWVLTYGPLKRWDPGVPPLWIAAGVFAASMPVVGWLVIRTLRRHSPDDPRWQTVAADMQSLDNAGCYRLGVELCRRSGNCLAVNLAGDEFLEALADAQG